MTVEARRLFRKLAAEGVSPWWAVSPWDDTSVLDAVAWGFRGIRMPLGAAYGAVRAACDALRADGGFVTLAATAWERVDDPATWVAAARALWSAVDRPNLLIGVPASPAGIAAVTDCLAEGIGVECTSVFSVRQYDAVLEAQRAGLERALARGVELKSLGVAASSDPGLLDAEVNARLDRLPRGAASGLRDTAGLATARLLYRARETALSCGNWQPLRNAGTRPPMLLWSVTRPEQVRSLVSWNTAHVMTVETAEAAARRDNLEGDTLMGRHAQSALALRLLAERDVDVEAVGAHLLRARFG
ncbi:transaldolase family protein [Streptomyces sp. NPDC005012]|uniref:transaldolase family protein n=1 Tax=unclassified Streptomyces TaxID=2593676 RepID=UPI0033A2528C